MTLSLLTAHSHADSQPIFSNILGNPGNPIHMISDIVDDTEACLQMAPFSWCFGVLKVDYVKKIANCVNTSDLSAKMVAQRFTTDEVIHFIMDIPDDGVESSNTNMFREEGYAEFDPTNVNGSD